MAIPKLPTIKELLANPKLAKDLTTPQLSILVNDLRDVLKNKLGFNVICDNPAEFATKTSESKWHSAPHLDYINDHLIQVERGLVPRLMISCPPRHGKTLFTSVWFPFWLLARDPKRRIILASYEARFAARWGRMVRDYVKIYGEQVGLHLDPESTAADNWLLEEGGGMVTVGAGGALTGRGADFLIIDDPIKNSEEASSELIRENLYNWYQTTASTRLEPGGSIICIATRWHQDDLLGRLEAESRSGEGLPWTIIKLAAISENDDPLGRVPGEPLWAERFPLKTEVRQDGRRYQGLEEIKQGLSPYNWSALYQQRPTPEEGGAVLRAWWRHYDSLPTDFDVMIQSWDLPFKDTAKSDFAVGQVWGRKGVEYFLIDQIRARMNAPTVINAILAFNKRYPKALAKLVEDKANGPAVIAMLQHNVAGMIPVKATASKDARLQAVIPIIQAGNVYLPQGDRMPWVWEYIDELAAFPNGSYDDQLDATTQALTYLQPQGWHVINQAWKEAKHGPPPKDPVDAMVKDFWADHKKAMKDSDKKWAASHRGIFNPEVQDTMW